MLKLTLQYFGHLMRTADSLEKTLMPDRSKAEEKRETEDEAVGWHHQFIGNGLGQTLGDGDRQGNLACGSSWGCRVRHDLVTEQQQTFFKGD